VITFVDTPAGERWIAFSSDPDLAERAVHQELVGTEVHVDGFELHI
jgi:hypothetical protein